MTPSIKPNPLEFLLHLSIKLQTTSLINHVIEAAAAPVMYLHK
jgi:hypothetical protein